MKPQEISSTPKQSRWSGSVTLKIVVVIILTLLLLIPSAMIKTIIMERQSLNFSTVASVSNTWGQTQLITGPVLTIPLKYREVSETTTPYTTEKKTAYVIRNLYIMPASLSVTGTIEPSVLHKGIYNIPVYSGEFAAEGVFDLDGLAQVDSSELEEIQYDKAFITIGISDLRGIKEDISFNWNSDSFPAEPGSRIPDLIHTGITMDIPTVSTITASAIPFNFTLALQGSQRLSFVPVGSTTQVKLTSSWNSPSFSGSFLPDEREVTDAGFEASWKVLKLNRSFPQAWTSDRNNASLTSSAFGVDLILPVDDYQKSMRSIKYAIMTIALTFLTFFLVEILNKKKIHPFQYSLVGLALCLFYVLLVSISEQSNFNTAYFISAGAIVLMISLYSVKVFGTFKLTFLLLSTLTGIYGFLYVTLQLEDYALLMGSIGLTLILGLTMYLTRNIDWYKLRIGTDARTIPTES